MKPVLLLVALLPALLRAQTADAIMSRVAENQTRAEVARAGFVYRQDVLVRLSPLALEIGVTVAILALVGPPI